MSSDLRDHPVGKFALPLFDHIDRDRFEVFAYSFNRGEADPIQAHIAQQVDAFRCWPEITSREAARRIAEDQLDMLIELGGPTAMNLPQVMAWRPARLQASCTPSGCPPTHARKHTQPRTLARVRSE